MKAISVLWGDPAWMAFAGATLLALAALIRRFGQGPRTSSAAE